LPVRTLSAIFGIGVQGFHLHHTEFSDIGFDTAEAANRNNIILVLLIRHSDPIETRDVRVHNVLARDLLMRASGRNYVTPFSLTDVNSITNVGVLDFYNVTVDNVRHADSPAATTVTEGRVDGLYLRAVGGTRTLKNNIFSNFIPTDEDVTMGSYYAVNGDGPFTPGPSPQPMGYTLVYNVGEPLPNGADTVDWDSGFHNLVVAGPGVIENRERTDPIYDTAPGPRFYHPTNPRVATGADDGSQMGAFGGPEGDWTPPSQRGR
jgi:hypothetical protein